MAVTFPIKVIVNDNALRWTNNSVVRFLKMSAESFRVRIDQTCLAIEPLTNLRVPRSVGLEVIQLAMINPRNENSPYIAPTICIPIELDHLGRLAILRILVQQQPHGRGRSPENYEFHATVLD